MREDSRENSWNHGAKGKRSRPRFVDKHDFRGFQRG